MTFNLDFTDVKVVLGVISGIIALSAYILYVFSILRGETRPSRVTWWIWSFMGLVLALSYHSSGAENTIWAAYMEFLGPFIVALLSIKYGEGGIEDRTDLVCLAGAFLSIVLWVVTKNPVVALVTGLAVDVFALVPTIKKSFLRPEGENFWAWFGTGVADSLNMFAVEKFIFAVLLYPVYMLLSDLIIIFILFFRKKNVIGSMSFFHKHE